MTEKEKSAFQILVDGDLDGIPIDMDKIEASKINFSESPDIDLSKKLGLTDNLYIFIGVDLRWLKRFNPKNHVIF